MEDMYFKVNDYFARTVQGATSDDLMELVDRMIDEGVITQEEYNAHEMEIHAIIDSGFFTCEGCSWTMPISEQDERGEWHCKQCMDEEHGDVDD